MSLLRVTLSINRTLIFILILLSLPLLVDLTRLPDSLGAQEYVFSTLTPCHGLRLCHLCGEILEMIDAAQRTLWNPFRDELKFLGRESDEHGPLTFQQCLQQPLLKGCDALMDKAKAHRVELAKIVLENVLENSRFRHKWGLLGEDYVIGNAMQLTAYIFDSQEFSAEHAAYQPSTFSLGGDPEMENLVTRVWFLRRDVAPLHYDFCYPLCEGKLSVFGRARLAFVRFYIRHAIKLRLLYLRREHRGTLVVAELVMIGLVVCIERLMGFGYTSKGDMEPRIGRVQSVTGASLTTCSGPVNILQAGDSAGAVDPGSGGSGGSGKVQHRSGRRKRWAMMTA